VAEGVIDRCIDGRLDEADGVLGVALLGERGGDGRARRSRYLGVLGSRARGLGGRTTTVVRAIENVPGLVNGRPAE
jgi:hypothetical protein